MKLIKYQVLLVFKERIEANNIIEGGVYDGTVDDISEKETLVNLLGLRAYISNSESSWMPTLNCNEHLEKDQQYQFKVVKIDFVTGTLHLSRRIDNENPWLLTEKPEIGERISVKIQVSSLGNLYGLYNNLTIFIPENEISWFSLADEEILDFIDNELEVEVVEIDEENYKINCSLRHVVSNPWPKIHELLPKGLEFNGKVTQIHEHFVKVEIDNYIIGVLPKESLQKAGHEYSNFKENMKIGQGVDVYISKVFVNKKKIRLDLARNKT